MIGDVRKIILRREVPGVKPVHFCLGQILQIGFATFRREERVMLTPEDQCLRLAITQESLPLRVELDMVR